MSEKARSCSQIDSAQEKENIRTTKTKRKSEQEHLHKEMPLQEVMEAEGALSGGQQRWEQTNGRTAAPPPTAPPPPAHLSLSSAHTVTTRRPLTGEK